MDRIIIAEDIKSLHQGLETVLSKFNVDKTEFVQYCDDAYLQIKNAESRGEPYDLLITDLSFAKDHREVKLVSGEDLIKKLLEDKISIKILIFSIEDRRDKIKKFFNFLNIDAFVCKGRNDQKDLEKAIKALQKNEKYYSKSLGDLFENTQEHELTTYDIQILELLEAGNHQSEISKHFKEHNISPSSTSSVEKRINNLKNFFKAKNTTNLVAKAKDLGII
ncbi:response regulator [Mesonia sp.]|uniref:response regulator n=1 Tax=Mesonia sp. TaxID=1960830 RepID=UPI00175D3F6D|nr:response regulator [Mesonia sp.]HIB38140.1 response regulator transcription factor [Mesonia sp.]HIO26091.1 response regulator transcription factor [Flavobacteriaceae bacterium]